VYARTTLLEIDTLRVPVETALAQFQSDVMPQLQAQPGFCGVYALTTPEGRAMLVTFWDTEAEADAGAESGWYPEVLREYTTMFKSPPGRECYEVRLAVPPVPAGTAR
jgi:heme-degrading monooxygenase HmoA